MQEPKYFYLFDVPISTLGLEDTLTLTSTQKLENGYVCFVNVHSITESLNNIDLKKALTQAKLCTADGLPIVWTSKILSIKNKIYSRVCGPDFMDQYLKNNPNECYGFIGSTQTVVEKIISKYNIKNYVYYSPPFEPFSKDAALKNWEEFQKECNQKQLSPTKIWVSLGAPKQELWMNTIYSANKTQGKLFLGVGAAFDFLSDNKKRAPLVFQKSGLEWLYRLIQEPRRLLKRYIITNSMFMWSLISNIANIKKTNE